MANWGVPDFKPDPQVDKDAATLRIQLAGKGLLTEWPKQYEVLAGYPPADVRKHCVQNAEWQSVRISMKGKPTDEKLAILVAWWEKNILVDKYRTEVQVGNYLGALRRGGQLDDQNRVRKYL